MSTRTTIKTKKDDIMNELSVMHTQEILGRTFRVYGTKEEPLMLAKDVAEWIDYNKDNRGYYDTNAMLRGVDEEEKLKIRPKQSLGILTSNNECWFLTEKGLYQVLVNSRKAVAKELLEALDIGYKINYKKTPLQTEFTFMLSHFLQEHITSYSTGGYNPIYLEEFKVGKYRLDYYFPKYGVIVEYDEKAHKYFLDGDSEREREIKKILGDGVKFIRVQEGKEFEGIIHIISELSKKFYESKTTCKP